ncbi:hypothetical protein IIW29_02695, partial [Candidatus Saccharibacteria bacterium]|nr:hypothetical protein [Candidatus Saccharibacteria bacterium]
MDDWPLGSVVLDSSIDEEEGPDDGSGRSVVSGAIFAPVTLVGAEDGGGGRTGLLESDRLIGG